MTRRGWCPSLYEPMASGDGLLVRVKPRAAILSAADAAFLADLATRHGNGVIELTSRANLQFRGLTATDAFADAVAGRGLACRDPAAERRCNVVVSPLAGVDPTLADGTMALASAVLAMLEGDAALSALPAKFGVVVDGGGVLPVSDAPGDILLQLQDEQVTISLAGDTLAMRATPGSAIAATRGLAGAFLQLGPDRRMRDLRAATVFAKAGFCADTQRLPAAHAMPVGTHRYGFGFGLPFGQLSAATLHALGDLALRHGDATLRMTPWRCIVLPGVDAQAAGTIDGVITDPADPALGVVACAGMPACGQASVPARSDALWLARSGAARGRSVHVSGCAKGCAHPAPAAFTLVGDAGRYRLVRDGRADAMPQTGPVDPRGGGLADGIFMTRDYERSGAAIYAKSFATIRAEAELTRFSAAEARVAVRVIHACGMVEIAGELVFSPDFAVAARAALVAGRPILCDAKMVAHGITRARLPAGNEVVCTLGDPGVPELAARIGNTRSAAALQLWGDRLDGALVAIGNAPTALFHLLDLLDAGASRPAAVIGLPVGFVGAAESKAALAEYGLPFLTLHGRRGGSAMTVAAVNALASEAE